MRTIRKVNEVVQNIGKYISGFAILVMMALILIDVFMRNIFGISLVGVYEIVASILMPLAVFPALGYAYWSGILPRLSEFILKMPNRFQKLNKQLIIIIDTVVFVLLTYYGILFAMKGLQDKMAVSISGTLVPVWPVYFLVPFGYIFVLLAIIPQYVPKSEEATINTK
jgi:TRAP-type C4-dicarboxylate transport system permease small subunit